MELETGKVKWFDNSKGFGFITPDNGSMDIFVHHSAIKQDGYRSLKENQRVEYRVTQGKKGLQAEDVALV